MKYYEISNTKSINGKVNIENSKNAILPILAATVLINDEVVIKKVPKFSDVYAAIDILSHLGKTIYWQNDNLIIKGTTNCCNISQELCVKLRASIFFLGAILSVHKKCELFLPGGCSFESRPIDYILNSLKSLGVEFYEAENKLTFNAKNMKSCKVVLPFASVGTTINCILASVFLSGETLIINAAKEPEIVDLCNFLNKCGAKVLGAGTSVIKIVGVKKLYSCEYSPIPDRIVAGTYLLTALALRGNVELCNFKATHNLPLLKKLLNCGCSYLKKCDTIYLKVPKNIVSFKNIDANVYPSFPTDLQPIALCAALSFKQQTIVTDNVFKNRFNYITELKKMDAKINVVNNSTQIIPSKLNGKIITAPDLRAGAGFVIAGLIAKGQTKIYNTHFIERGYENFAQKLQNIGANILVKEEE